MEWKQVEHIVRKEVDRQFRLGKTLDLKRLYKESFTGYTPQSEEKNLFGRKCKEPAFFQTTSRENFFVYYILEKLVDPMG